MRKKVTNVLTGLFVAVAFGLAGCGGGSGGGSSVDTSYKGSTTQATVTASNASALSVDAIQGAQNIAALDVLGKSVTDTSESSPLIPTIANILEDSIIRILPKSAVAKTVAGTAQDTVNGYSGSYSYSVNANESTGAFTGSIRFNSYKEDQYSPSISGYMSCYGIVNTATGNIVSINMSISDLQAASGTLNGNIAISNGTTSTNMNISIVLLDNTDNKTYWLKDFSLVLTNGMMSISGTYYDHDYGYVVISTVIPLTVSTYSSIPTSGQLLFTGSNGTKARLTYTDSGYTVEVDASGNNTYVVIPYD